MSQTASLSEFAAIINRVPSYVTKLKQSGRLVLDEHGKVRVAESQARILETESGQHERGREYQRARRTKSAGPDVSNKKLAKDYEGIHYRSARHGDSPAPQAGEGEDLEADATKRNTRAFHDNRIAAANAEMREMEVAKAKGELVDRADVDFVLNDYGATVRGLLQRLADRLSPQVYPLKTLEETHAAIVEAVDELQRELDETMKRRSAGLGT